MPMPRAPIDPYCRLNGRGARVTPDDSDPNLAALAIYANANGVHVWRYADDKIALTSEAFTQGRAAHLSPLVFGSEGATLERNASEALSALHEQSANLTQYAKAAKSIEDQVRAGRVDAVPPTADPVDSIQAAIEPGELTQTVDTYLRDLPTIEESARELTGHRWLGGNRLAVVEDALAGLGEAGKKAKVLFRRKNELADRLEGSALTRLKAAAERLTPAERASGFADFVEKGVLADESRRPVLTAVQDEFRAVNNQFYGLIKQNGGTVAERVGPSPLNPTGEYFPHRRDLTALGDQKLAASMVAEVQRRGAEYGVQLTEGQALDIIEQQGWGTIKRERAVEKLIEAAARHEHTLPEADARRLLDHIVEGADRISGSVERERTLDFDGYVKDVLRAYTATWKRNANRVAELVVFGPHDENVHQLLGEMRYDPTLGGRGERFLKQVYDLEVGRSRLDMSALGRELYGWQATKLSLGLLANSLQSLNTALRVGLKPFARAAFEGLTRPREFGGGLLKERETIATRSGALPVQMFASDTTTQLINAMGQDARDSMQSMFGRGTTTGRALGGGVDKFLGGMLAPFRWVENWNRSVAQRAGEYYFDQLAEQLGRRGEAGLAHRAIGSRLRELDFNPQRVLAAVQSNDRQALNELRTLAGLRVSNETQFRSNFQSMPYFANTSEPGRFLFQYKNFALNQARFMLRELSPAAARRDPARFLRAVATIGVAYPAAGILLTQIRGKLTGPSLASDELQAALEEPGVLNLIQAAGIAMTTAGGLGILGDIGMTATLGNSYAIRNFFIPPAASTVTNFVDATGSAARGIVNGDPDELKRARKSLLRELGGLGGAVENRLEQREGTADEAPDVVGALTRRF